LLSFLPENNLETAPYFPPSDDPRRMDEELASLVPDSPRQPYDIREAVGLVVDDGSFSRCRRGGPRTSSSGSPGSTGTP
jgi:propionyl-CoA carboxylase beta chain